MPATFAKDGALNAMQGGNDTGAASSGIGVGANSSGVAVPGNFTVSASDFLAYHIGGGVDDAVAPSTASASNTGRVVQGALSSFTAGSGYTDGTYKVGSNASGGRPAGTAEILFTVVGGVITSARVSRAGNGFTSAPTFTVANAINVATGAGPGAGTLGAFTVAVGYMSQAYALGAAYGTNKNMQRLQAVGAVAIDAAVTPSTYLNRSGRALVAGDSLWAVAP